MKVLVIFSDPGNENAIPNAFIQSTLSFLKLGESLKQKGVNLYISKSYNDFLGNNKYKYSFEYIDGKFIKKEGIVEPYKILDKSKLIYFPSFNSTNVINTLDFKLFAKNKWITYLTLPEFFPRTYLIEKSNKTDYYLQLILDDGVTDIVVKDTTGLAGNLVARFNLKKEPKAFNDFVNLNKDKIFIAQEFIDTSLGLPELGNSYKDLRIIFINNKIATIYMRFPIKEGEFRSNYSLGGDFVELTTSQLPEKVLEFATSINKEISHRFGNPFYGMDLAVSKDEIKLFELNDQVAFPSDPKELIWPEVYINELTNLLIS